MMRQVIDRLRFQVAIVIAIVMFVWGLYLFAATHSYLVLLIFGCIGGVLYSLAHGKLAFRKQPLNKSDFYTILLLAGLHIWGIISVCAYNYRLIFRYGIIGIRALLICIFTLVVAAILLCLLVIQVKAICSHIRNEPPWKTWRPGNMLAMLCLLVFLLMLNLGSFNTWPRWDNYAYFTELKRLDLHSLFTLSSLRVANHATYAYSFLYIAINTAFDNPNFSAYVLNFIFLLGGTLCFRSILGKLFPHWGQPQRFLATCIFAFSPYYLGQMTCINLEFYSAFALLLFLAGEANKMRVLQFIAAILLCFGKESSTVVLVFMMLGKLLANIIVNRPKVRKEWIAALDLSFSLPVLSIGLLWLWDLLQHNWMSTNQAEFLTVDGHLFNSFGFSPIYIWDTLKTLLCANFDWVCIVICCAALILWLIRRIFQRRIPELSLSQVTEEPVTVLWFELIGSFIGGIIMQLLFITYNNIRYNSSLIPAIYLFTFTAIGVLFNRQWIKNAVFCLLACALIVQCFFTIDPVMLSVLPRFKIGHGYIVSSENNVIGVGAEFIDSAQYNWQIRDFDKAFDQLLSKIEYDTTNTCVMISSEYETLTVGGVCSAIHLILGFGYPYYVSNPQNVVWDTANQRRELSDDTTNLLNVFFISSPDEVEALGKQYQHAFYFRMPWEDQLYSEQLSSQNFWGKAIESNYHGWTLYAYEYMPA